MPVAPSEAAPLRKVRRAIGWLILVSPVMRSC
jgi:hypothetical protein